MRTDKEVYMSTLFNGQLAFLLNVHIHLGPDIYSTLHASVYVNLWRPL